MESSGSNSHAHPPQKVNQNIQVYLRVRPMNAREKCMRSAENVDVISQREVVTRHGPDSKLTKKFTFDRTFNSDSKQVDVYCAVVSPLIEEVLSGYNCTVFAYGQTGTGKTHTMVGNECAELKSSWEDDSEIGIIPRALCHLFDELRMMKVEFSMRISYLELYNEELCDLLSSDESTKIRIYDDNTKKGSVIIQGLEEIPVHSKEDVYKLLEKGKERRKTATTLMNAMSSRSHTVFSILVHIKENGIDGEEMLKIGKLNLVDLAGSENVSKAGNEKGIRTRETVNINQSLLTLGRVITALVERTPHIPYRESKLTRLLQESLGGRTKTSIIATVSPGHKDIDETLSTLEYAHRAKNIQNKPEINQKLTKKVVLKEYTEEIDKLKRDLMAARDKNGIYLAEETYSEITLKMDSQNRELNEKLILLKALKEELSSKEKLFNEVSLHLVEKTEKLNEIEENLKKTTGDLIKTKKVLHSTKRRYREKKVVIDSHVETEKSLKNQATKIMEVADVATQDAEALHKTIDRRKEVDVNIQTACDRFSERMYDNFEILDENLQYFRNQQLKCSNEISLELEKITHSQTQLLQNTKRKISEINNICENFLKKTSKLEQVFSNYFKGFNEGHQNGLIFVLEEMRKKEQEFRHDIKENLSSLDLCNKQQKAALDSMHLRIIERFRFNNTDVKKHTETVNSTLDDIKHKSLESVQELQKLTITLNEENSMMEEEAKLIEELQRNIQSFHEKHLKKKKLAETVSKNVEYLDNCQQTIVNTASNTTKLNTEYTDNQALELENNCVLMEQEISNVKLSIDESVAKCSIINTQVDNMVQETSAQTQQISSDHAKYLKGLLDKTDTNENERKALCLDNSEKVKETTNNISVYIDNFDKCLNNNVNVVISKDSLLQESVEHYVESFNKQVMNCNRDIDLFKRSECKTYKATGATPKKKEFTYPRILAETSPHTCIVKRFRQENNWSDMDTTLPIDEESDFCDVEENDIVSIQS